MRPNCETWRGSWESTRAQHFWVAMSPGLLPGLDVACLSSVHEGMPVTLIEAMAAGLPIVATDCGSVRDTVEDGEQGFVVPVGDVENFADRLQRLAHQEPLRIRLGKSGRARVESEFQIQDIARGTRNY